MSIPQGHQIRPSTSRHETASLQERRTIGDVVRTANQRFEEARATVQYSDYSEVTPRGIAPRADVGSNFAASVWGNPRALWKHGNGLG